MPLSFVAPPDFTTGQIVTEEQLDTLSGDLTQLHDNGVWLVAETTLATAAATIDLQNIPQTYRHLELVITSKAVSGGQTGCFGRFNNDSDNTYDRLYDGGMDNGTDVGAGGTALSSAEFGAVAGSSGGGWGLAKVLIGEYATTSRHKMYTGHSVTYYGTDAAGNFETHTDGGRWRSTAAVNRITVFTASGVNLAAGSSLSLYGVH